MYTQEQRTIRRPRQRNANNARDEIRPGKPTRACVGLRPNGIMSCVRRCLSEMVLFLLRIRETLEKPRTFADWLQRRTSIQPTSQAVGVCAYDVHPAAPQDLPVAGERFAVFAGASIAEQSLAKEPERRLFDAFSGVAESANRALSARTLQSLEDRGPVFWAPTSFLLCDQKTALPDAKAQEVPPDLQYRQPARLRCCRDLVHRLPTEQ